MKLTLLLLILMSTIEIAAARDYFLYVGPYTKAKSTSKGIYAWRYDSNTAKLTPIGLAAETSNPSFLVAHPNGRFLYAVNENNDGTVSSFSLDHASGKLTFLNKVPTKGAAPCHLVVDKTGKYLLVANYSGGSVAVFPIHADGTLGEDSSFVQHQGGSNATARQKGPHGHCIRTSPDNKFALAADLGLDELLVYKFDATKGTLTPNDPPFGKLPPGSGPRHFVFAPNGKFVYVINEIASTMTTFAYDPGRGALKELQTLSTLPADFHGESTTAEVEIDPKGKFVYGSNRGNDSIAVFSVGANGTLSLVEIVPTKGKTPRNFALDPTGAHVFAANQDTNNVVMFQRDANTGKLTATNQSLEVAAPVCVIFVPVK